jgi:hypothetical protein
MKFPNRLEFIGSRAFWGNLSLTLVEFDQHSRFTFIDDEAFATTGLCSIHLPDSLHKIGVGSFSDASLRTVLFGQGLIMIGICCLLFVIYCKMLIFQSVLKRLKQMNSRVVQ